MAPKPVTKRQKRATVARAVQAWKQRRRDSGLCQMTVWIPPEHKEQIRKLEKALQKGARIT